MAFSLADLVSSGRALRRAAEGAPTFDAAADAIVRRLYDDLRAPDGRRACALVRCFRTRALHDLDEDARAFATSRLEDPSTAHDQLRCLALAATAGDEPEWNAVETSRGHRALPLPSPDVVRDSPMIARLMGEFGIDIGALTGADAGGLIVDPGQPAFNVFHVEEARGSSYVPAQTDFVERYGIESVLGFGATLADDELFAVILFSRAPITRPVASRFEPLALHARTALLPYGRSADDPAPLAVEVQALHELLDLEERVVTEQARALEERARTMRFLSLAATEVHAARDLPSVLDRITQLARVIVPAKQSVTSLTVDEDWAQSITSVDLHEDYAAWRDYDVPPDGSGIYATLVAARNEVARMTQEELEAHPDWKGFGDAAADHPPMRGWLAAPLVARDGANLGLIQLSDREDGEFTAEDEYAIVQLAQLGSLAIENIRLAEAEALQRGERFREELLAGLSHDMKTPLVAVVGLAEALEHDDDLTPEARERTRRAISRQARSLENLVMQFLDYTRLEAGRPLSVNASHVDLTPTVHRAAELFAHLRDIDVRVDPDLPVAVADERRVTQILTNLLSNAVKFSPPGTAVVLSARGEDDTVALSVADEGTGLRPDQVLSLFQKFYRADNATKVSGSGLGLYVSRLLADAMGGTLTVDTEPGRGSTFTLRVPVAEDGPGPTEHA